MTTEQAIADIKSASTEMLLAGRFQANNGKSKREHGYRMEEQARAKMIAALAVLSAAAVR